MTLPLVVYWRTAGPPEDYLNAQVMVAMVGQPFWAFAVCSYFQWGEAESSSRTVQHCVVSDVGNSCYLDAR